MSIGGIGGIQPITLNGIAAKAKDNKTVDFSTFLKDAIDNVNTLPNESEKAGELLAAGKVDNLHQVMIASEKASLALQMTVQVRNKIMDAYGEIMRMTV